MREILARHVPEREVRAFGSRVAEPAKKFFDLDLAVMGGTPLPFTVIADLEEDFSESNLPFKVDDVQRRIESLSIIEPHKTPDSCLVFYVAAQRAQAGLSLESI